MARGFEVTDRRVLRLSGGDVHDFLQNLVTNDIDSGTPLVYAALLTPQGKYLFDFFMFRDGDDWLLDVAGDRADALVARLTMYKLRADVTIRDAGLRVWQMLDGDIGWPDPRHGDLGRRYYGADAPELVPMDRSEFDALRVALGVPETGRELLADETFILEAGFERLNGVDFKKGCYVGQEVTARMKHKTELRKGIVGVEVSDGAEYGTDIMNDGKVAGRLLSVAGNRALAYLRFDRAGPGMTSGEAKVTYRG